MTDRWTLQLDPTDATLAVDGDGRGNPDLAVATGNDVPCTAPGAPVAPPPGPAPVQHVACTLHLPANP